VHGPNPCTPSSKTPPLPPPLSGRPACRGYGWQGGLSGRGALLAAMVGGGRPLASPPKAKGKGRRKGGGGVSGGKGGPRFHPAPPFPRPALSHLWAGLPNFGDSVVVTARPAQRSEKIIGAA
jgi:hypothetical protein